MSDNTRPEMNDTDRDTMSKAFDAGNYAAAYETEDYSAIDLSGANGFYRVGHMLGFFSSYETHEISGEINGADLSGEVEHYRTMFPEYA